MTKNRILWPLILLLVVGTQTAAAYCAIMAAQGWME